MPVPRGDILWVMFILGSGHVGRNRSSAQRRSLAPTSRFQTSLNYQQLRISLILVTALTPGADASTTAQSQPVALPELWVEEVSAAQRTGCSKFSPQWLTPHSVLQACPVKPGVGRRPHRGPRHLASCTLSIVHTAPATLAFLLLSQDGSCLHCTQDPVRTSGPLPWRLCLEPGSPLPPGHFLFLPCTVTDVTLFLFVDYSASGTRRWAQSGQVFYLVHRISSTQGTHNRHLVSL